MGLFKKALKIVGEVTGISTVGDILGVIKGNPDLEEKLAQLELEEADNIRALYKAEVQSEDKFVRRCRPALLWLVFTIIGMNFVALPLFNTIAGYFGYTSVELIYPSLPDEIYALFGVMFSVYTGSRTYEKVKKANK